MERCSTCIKFVSGSLDSSTRGFALYRETLVNETVIFVSFCRTVTWMDWTANSNAIETVCEELGSNIKIHKGFASIATKTQRLLRVELNSLINASHGPCQIILTGHSGGGAIAQLLFGFMNS